MKEKKYIETETVELKEIINDDLEKEVVAFLNSHYGVIYIGINNDGEIVGVENYDSIILKIVDRLKNNIEPSIIGLFDSSSTKYILLKE